MRVTAAPERPTGGLRLVLRLARRPALLPRGALLVDALLGGLDLLAVLARFCMRLMKMATAMPTAIASTQATTPKTLLMRTTLAANT